jgi:hexokinase
MADVPKDLMQEIKRLEELFTVDTEKLKAITEHFVSELTKGEPTRIHLNEFC